MRRSDRVILTRPLAPAVPTWPGAAHYIGCTLPEAIAHACPGERIWLDDGKTGGTIDAVDTEEIALTATDFRPDGADLKAAKGSTLSTPTSAARTDTQGPRERSFVAARADVVNLSFAQDEKRSLLRRLQAWDHPR